MLLTFDRRLPNQLFNKKQLSFYRYAGDVTGSKRRRQRQPREADRLEPKIKTDPIIVEIATSCYIELHIIFRDRCGISYQQSQVSSYSGFCINLET